MLNINNRVNLSLVNTLQDEDFVCVHFLRNTFRGWLMCVQWALGVALWELMTSGLEPYADVPLEKLASYLHRGFRLSQPLSCPSSLYVHA